MYHPELPHAQSLFLFPIVFGINSTFCASFRRFSLLALFSMCAFFFLYLIKAKMMTLRIIPAQLTHHCGITCRHACRPEKVCELTVICCFSPNVSPIVNWLQASYQRQMFQERFTPSMNHGTLWNQTILVFWVPLIVNQSMMLHRISAAYLLRHVFTAILRSVPRAEKPKSLSKDDGRGELVLKYACLIRVIVECM